MRRFDLPLSLDVSGRRCVVLGGGPEATDKAGRLLAAGARVQLVATALEPALLARVEAGDAAWAARSWEPGDLADAFLVYLTPEERDSAPEAWALRQRYGFLLCSIDDPEHCDFSNPAQVRAGHLTLSITTGGRAPALAKRLREVLELTLATGELASFVDALAQRRDAAGEGRSAQGKSDVADLRVEVSVRFPEWFEQGHEPTK